MNSKKHLARPGILLAVVFAVVLAVLAIILMMPEATKLKDDEFVMFMPGIAYDVNDNETAMEVSAFVYEKERRPGATTVFSRLLGVDVDALSPAEKSRLYARSALFRLDFEGGKEFDIKVEDGSLHKLPKTRDGKTGAVLTLKKTDVRGKEINFEVNQPEFPENLEKGTALYASAEGVAAVFDIDDTIKDSNVLNKKVLLLNTFINEYKAIDEVRPIFEYIKSLDNPSFHYVSASPVQLYPALREFLEREGFPKGSFHLRGATDISDLVLTKKELVAHKTTQIEKLFAAYPGRKFVLVGDSGENDPEIYASFKRKYPDKVILIAIHDVKNEGKASPRFEKVFQNLDDWMLF
jgi:hypothetical protein